MYMKMIKVESSNVNAVGYNPSTKDLRVEFKGGSVYQYSGVPHIVFIRFITAESHGQFLVESIKNNYEHKKIKGGK